LILLLDTADFRKICGDAPFGVKPARQMLPARSFTRQRFGVLAEKNISRKQKKSKTKAALKTVWLTLIRWMSQPKNRV